MLNKMMYAALCALLTCLLGCATTASHHEDDDPKQGASERAALVERIEREAAQYWDAKKLLEQCLREQQFSRRSEPEACLPQRQKLREAEIGPLCEQYWEQNDRHVAPHCPCPVQGLISAGYRY